MADIVDRQGVDLVFGPKNPADLCRKLEQLRKDEEMYGKIRENGLDASGKYDRSILAWQMLEVPATLIENRKNSLIVLLMMSKGIKVGTVADTIIHENFFLALFADALTLICSTV